MTAVMQADFIRSLSVAALTKAEFMRSVSVAA
jgi:hypothetical protein